MQTPFAKIVPERRPVFLTSVLGERNILFPVIVQHQFHHHRLQLLAVPDLDPVVRNIADQLLGFFLADQAQAPYQAQVAVSIPADIAAFAGGSS